jgi:hypothetical protein
VVVDPGIPATLYAITGSSTFKSTDSGVSWSKLKVAKYTASFSALIVDPLHPGTLYAGSYSGLYKSSDGGLNWEKIKTSLGETSINSLAIGPAKPFILYIGTRGGRTSKAPALPPSGYRASGNCTGPSTPSFRTASRQERSWLPGPSPAGTLP